MVQEEQKWGNCELSAWVKGQAAGVRWVREDTGSKSENGNGLPRTTLVTIDLCLLSSCTCEFYIIFVNVIISCLISKKFKSISNELLKSSPPHYLVVVFLEVVFMEITTKHRSNCDPYKNIPKYFNQVNPQLTFHLGGHSNVFWHKGKCRKTQWS